MKRTGSIKQLITVLKEVLILKTVSIKLLLMTFLPAIAVLGVIAVISILYQIPIPTFTRDTTAIAGYHPITGVLSNLGILLWCVAATTCAFAAFILRSVKSRDNYLYLLFSSLLTAYLMFDDLFLIHEELSTMIGLNGNVIFVLLGIALIAYFLYFIKIIFQTDIIIFLLAVAFLSLSLVADTIGGESLWAWLDDWSYLIEDGAKWIGIVFWCCYYVNTSFHFTASIVDVSNKNSTSNFH